MKKILTVAAAMFALTAMSSCHTSSSASPSYSMRATVGSTAFNTNYAIASANGSGGLFVEGYNRSGTFGNTPTPPYMSMTILSYIGVGTYTVDSIGQGVAAYFPDTSVTADKISRSGTITITSTSSTTIVGTFSFTAKDGTIISGGSFTANKIM